MHEQLFLEVHTLSLDVNKIMVLLLHLLSHMYDISGLFGKGQGLVCFGVLYHRLRKVFRDKEL